MTIDHPPMRRPDKEPIRLLNGCRDMAEAHLRRALQSMLDKVDDTLFDLAEKSESNAVQSAYFDAMREVRLRRERMEEEFRRQFLEACPRAAQSEPMADTHDGSNEAGLGKLMLVNNDDLEETVAITNMINKLEAAAKEELFALDKRVGLLIGDPSLERHENPLGPKAVCEAAKHACRQVESGIEVKLIILKLFDKLVVSTVPALYQTINDYLVQAGILPEIRRVVVRNEAAVSTAGSAVAGGPHGGGIVGQCRAQGSQEGGAGVGLTATGAGLDAVAAGSCAPDLLATLRSVMAANGLGQRSSRGAVHTEQLRRVLGDLTLVQRGHTEALGWNTEHAEEGALAGNRPNVLRHVKTTNIAAGVGQVDDMMIDIVAMMFDYILDDKNLSDSIKALIGRLQIPILKVAILDKSFFSRKFHPARKLLNNIAEAAIGWREERDRNDVLFKKIEAIVHRILSEFEDDTSVFSKLLEDFERFLAEYERSSVASRHESADIAEGREKLRAAKTIAQDEVTRRISTQGIPEIIRAFLDSYWKGLLIVSYVNYGNQGDDWKRHIETMDDLIWSVSPKPTPEERLRLVGLLPDLVKRLNEAMARASMDPKERDHFIAKLADYHAQVVKPVVDEESTTTEVPASETTFRTEPGELTSASFDASDGSARRSCQFGETTGDASAQTSELACGIDGGAATLAMRLVRSAILKANSLVFRTAQRQPQCKGMGTTLVAAVFAEHRVTIAHVGDSRLYRLRNDQLQQMTVDHSLQQELVAKGFYTPEEAKTSVNKNIVTRAIGVEPTVTPDLREEAVLEGDIYLLCSDGLSDLVTEQEMRSILKQSGGNLEVAADLLVALANDNGGKDNISVVLAGTPALGSGDNRPRAERVAGQGMQIVTRSDVGRKRSHNEDSVRADSEIGVAVLADGMGGYNAGEVASAIAVNLVADELIKGLSGVVIKEGDGEEHDETHNLEGENEQLDARYLRELFDKGDVEVEEITIQDVESGLDSPELVDEHNDAARSLEIGSWVEFRRPGRMAVRARLTWISSVTGAYLFTDRQGLKVADSTVHGLAVEFRRGTAAIIDDVPLFDRAVGSLMERLKHSSTSLAG